MWPEKVGTQELVQSAAAGSAQAVNALLDRHRVALRRMIELRLDRRLTQRIDASDVVQDVMLEATGRLQEYLADSRIPFHLWLRQLAQDRMIDLYRRHHAHRRSVDREQPLARREFGDKSSLDLAAQLQDMELTPAAALIRKELEQRFLEAVHCLEDRDREVILMRHVEQLGNGEVAQSLGLSEAAAGMRYLRAIKRLKTLLAGEEETGA